MEASKIENSTASTKTVTVRSEVRWANIAVSVIIVRFGQLEYHSAVVVRVETVRHKYQKHVKRIVTTHTECIHK